MKRDERIHEFLIKNGRKLADSSEYDSYQRCGESKADLLKAFKAGEIRPDTAEEDGRLTSYEYEQAWKERRGIVSN